MPDDDPVGDSAEVPGPAQGLRLRSLPGGGRAPSDPFEVRLRREFKGLTVSELVTDLSLSERLPGQVRSALERIEEGDLAAADQLLPGRFGSVLAGPGHRRVGRLHMRWLLLSLAVLAAVVAVARMV